jgi:uncharacterized protein
MRCKYCYETVAPNFMDEALAIDACEWVLKRRKRKDKPFHFDLFGGEPLLNFDVVYEVLKFYAGRSDIRFILFTNGSIWDDRLPELVRDKNYCVIQISIDGAKETQDLQRPFSDGSGSFDKVFANLKRLQAELNYDVPIKPVLSPSRVKYLVEDVSFLVGEGFRLIGHSLLREDIDDEVWTDEALELYEQKLYELADYYEMLLKKNNNAILSLFIDPILAIIKKVNVACWAGRTGVAIDYKGDIWPCARFRNEVDLMGNIHKPFKYDVETYAFEQRNYKNLVCGECSLEGCCAGGCPAAQRKLTGSSNIPIPCVCKLYKITHKVATELFNKMKDNQLYLNILEKGLSYE